MVYLSARSFLILTKEAPLRPGGLSRKNSIADFQILMNSLEEEAMAICAYIFIETTQGKAKTIAREIAQIPGVKTAHTVTGPYDVITYVEAESIRVLGDFIVSKIQATAGVLRTLTNVVIDAE
jgi:DNA-binding Lrp family transcriptional regulator